MTTILLPHSDGSLKSYRVGPASPYPEAAAGPSPRTVYAAAHVVADPAGTNPWGKASLDWDATLAFRSHLWRLGFKIAEAMDTSQRGMGFDWGTAQELIRRSIRAAQAEGGDLASGAGTDHLDPAAVRGLDDVIRAYEEQIGFIEGEGGRVILMASRALARVAKGPEDYAAVYGRILRQTREPVILHWLGDMFDPALAGYWGGRDLDAAEETVLGIIRDNRAKVEGIKISLLDKDREIGFRRRLPEGVVMYTGDDFNYAELIAGDHQGYSHGLLGIFDPIAPAAAAALPRLAAGDLAGYHAILDPTVPLSRTIFEAPTQYYKAGIVLLAWLNGFQDHFTMVGGMQSARGILHYAQVFRLADGARLLRDPDLAVRRMTALCAVHGIEPARSAARVHAA
ncbi:MAG TPA: dihydrodipicolinate synthase family protein [Microvirga sp.]|jgi:hypothetical protein|nr:dihydrodipicolinate synthase family protein [Microvirga sp.]